MASWAAAAAAPLARGSFYGPSPSEVFSSKSRRAGRGAAAQRRFRPSRAGAKRGVRVYANFFVDVEEEDEPPKPKTKPAFADVEVVEEGPKNKEEPKKEEPPKKAVTAEDVGDTVRRRRRLTHQLDPVLKALVSNP